MAEEKEAKHWTKKVYIKKGGSGGAIYGLGVLGVAVYYIQHAASFWIGVLGVIKAFFWPALVVYKVFELLHL